MAANRNDPSSSDMLVFTSSSHRLAEITKVTAVHLAKEVCPLNTVRNYYIAALNFIVYKG